MATATYTDELGASHAIPLPVEGRVAIGAARGVGLCTEDFARLGLILDALDDIVAALADVTTSSPVHASGREYEFVAASSSNQPLGATGAAGDELDGLIIIPLTTSPGEVKIKDGTAGTYRTVFLGGTDSVGDLKPFTIALGLKSLATGGWIINTGANVQVYAPGNFT